VFEGMRTVLFEHRFDTLLCLRAIELNLVYLGLGITVFLWVFRLARERGLLLQTGE
jgi:ABC-2 type transport system permease protein